VKISFYQPDAPDVEKLLALDPDKEWFLFTPAQRWVAQTYFRLKNRGHDLSLTNHVPDSGIVVYQQRHHDPLVKALGKKKNKELILVCIRGDKSESIVADFEIVQNDKWADNNKFFYIPFWPQPGLIPRDKSRGTRVEVVSFKGFNTNLHKYFFKEKWFKWIIENGFKWQLDSQKFDSSNEMVTASWHDYKEVDVIIALRNKKSRIDQIRGFTSKPAAKLYNAWHAGVPVILGPEYAYQQIRKSKLDYIEVENINQVKETLLYLKENPSYYNKMVENGFNRAADYTVDKIASMWEDFLFEEIPLQLNKQGFQPIIQLPLKWRMLYQKLNRLVVGRPER